MSLRIRTATRCEDDPAEYDYMKKILILSNSASGLYEFRTELIQNLLGDHEVYISLPEEPDDKYVAEFAGKGCHMIHTPFERRGMNPARDYDLLKAYKQIMRDICPDVVFTYTIKPNIYGGLAAKSLKIPYFTNVTGLGTAILGGGVLARGLMCLYRLATRQAACIFFQNSSNLEFMTSHGIGGRGNVRLLPGSGVNLSVHSYRPYPSDEDGIRILSVLRIMEDKGMEELLKAIDVLGTSAEADTGQTENATEVTADKRIHFTIAGNYEEETRAEYEPEIERLSAEGKLTYLGFVDEMDPVYADSHIVAHPSYHEGLSNVCLEAAACGRPVVTTDIPGCRETVNDESGILCKPRSSFEFIRALEKMIALTSAEREAMGRAGRTHVEKNFDRNLVIRAYREELDKIRIGNRT